MKRLLQYITCLLFGAASFQIALARGRLRLHIKIVEADTKKVTPAMVCITNVNTGNVHVPPLGLEAGEPTYPNIFFNGIRYTKNKNWIGPIRKMSGTGTVNGQRTYVYGALPTLPYWAEPVIYQTTGNFTIELTPGKWRISIEHGNEYVPLSEEVVVAPGKARVKKTFVLKRWIDLPAMGWFSGDVHAHHPLNKKSFRNYILKLAEAEDVHLVNILQMGDRQNIYFTPQGFGKQFQIKKGDIWVASGQEEPRSDYGHIIGLNIASLARDTSHYNHYDLVFDKIHRKPAALTGYAHFAYGGEGVREGLALYAPSGAIDFVELLQNGQLNTTGYYTYLNLGFKLTAAAGSDFPWGSTIGDGRTYAYTGRPFSAGKWFAAVKQGRTFVSNGPALFLTADGKLPGAEIIRQNKATVKITVKAFSNPTIGIIDKIQVYNNDGLLFEKLNAGHLDSIIIDTSYTLIKSQWMTGVVHCSNNALAHTSPVYFMVDGRPCYDTVKGPYIIQDLLTVLEKAKRSELAKPVIDQGLIERINKAEEWYKILLANRQKEP